MAKTSDICRHFSPLKIHCDVLIYTTTYLKLEQSYPGQSDVIKMTQAARRIIWEILLKINTRKNCCLKMRLEHCVIWHWNAVLGHTAAEMGTSITKHQVESVPSHQTHNAITNNSDSEGNLYFINLLEAKHSKTFFCSLFQQC